MFCRPKLYDDGQGWEKIEQGILECVLSIRPILPLSLIDLLEKAQEDEVEEEADEEIDYDKYDEEK